MVAAEDGVSVSLDRNSMSMTVDQTETLKAEVYPGGTVSWASSDETVAAVDENGCVTAVGEGMAVITATVSIGGKTWSDQCTVTVTDVPAEGDGPEAEDGGATVIVPGPEAMEVPGKPEGVSDEAFHQAVTGAEESVAGMAGNTAVAGNPNAVSGIGEAVLAAGLLGENEKAEISLEQRLEHVEFAAELIKDADGTVTGVKLLPRKLVFDVSAFRTLLNEKNEPILSTKEPLNMDSSLMKRKYFTFRLPVPASVEERYANVDHEGEGVRQYTIAGNGDSRYIPVETWHLSRFTVTFTDQKLVRKAMEEAEAEKPNPMGPEAAGSRMRLAGGIRIRTVHGRPIPGSFWSGTGRIPGIVSMRRDIWYPDGIWILTGTGISSTIKRTVPRAICILDGSRSMESGIISVKMPEAPRALSWSME